jgi:hypothetical protein
VQLFAGVGLARAEHRFVDRDGQDQPLQLLGGQLWVVDAQLAVLSGLPEQSGQTRGQLSGAEPSAADPQR